MITIHYSLYTRTATCNIISPLFYDLLILHFFIIPFSISFTSSLFLARSSSFPSSRSQSLPLYFAHILPHPHLLSPFFPSALSKPKRIFGTHDIPATAFMTCVSFLSSLMCPGAFLAAAVWGNQWGGHICIWGPRIPDDIMHD